MSVTNLNFKMDGVRLHHLGELVAPETKVSQNEFLKKIKLTSPLQVDEPKIVYANTGMYATDYVYVDIPEGAKSWDVTGYHVLYGNRKDFAKEEIEVTVEN